MIARGFGSSYRPPPMRTVTVHWFNRSRSAARRLSVATAVCSVLLSACGLHTGRSGQGIRRQTRGISLNAPGPTGQSAAETEQTGQVVSAWFSAEQAFMTAALTSDPNEPDLAITTVSPQLNWSQALLRQMHAAGEVARGAVEYGSPQVLNLEAREATVQSCVHDAEIVVVAASGRPVSGELGRVDFELITSTMESTISGWKLLTQQVSVDQCD